MRPGPLCAEKGLWNSSCRTEDSPSPLPDGSKKDVATIRSFIWGLCEPDEEAKPFERMFYFSLLALITLNVIAVLLSSVPPIFARFSSWFEGFEYLSVGVFTLEYFARLWSCTTDLRCRHSLWGRLRYASTPMVIFDLLSILPFYVTRLDADLRVIRIFRLLRLARIVKYGRYSRGAKLLLRVVKARRQELVITLSFVFLASIVFATLAYYAEYRQNPSEFPDIPHALWWALVTVTTVCYGDVKPVTALGKIIGTCTAILGILFIALPTSVLSSAFIDELRRRRDGTPRCPHCGKSLDAGKVPTVHEDSAPCKHR